MTHPLLFSFQRVYLYHGVIRLKCNISFKMQKTREKSLIFNSLPLSNMQMSRKNIHSRLHTSPDFNENSKGMWLKFYASCITTWTSCLATWDLFRSLSSALMLVFPSDHLNLTQLYSSTFIIWGGGGVFLKGRSSLSADWALITSSFKKRRCWKRNDLREGCCLFWRRKKSTRFIFISGYYLFCGNRKEKKNIQ